MIKPYFENKAWKKIKTILEQKKLDEWECKKCNLNLDKTVDDSDDLNDKKNEKRKISIGCDYCLEWFHLKCAALKKMPRSKLWICENCKDDNN